MAFNLQTFKTRSLTAVVFVVVMLSGLLFNYYSFLILFSLVHFGCWFEYQKLVGVIDPKYKEISLFHKYGIMLLGWSFMLYISHHVFITVVGKWLMLAMVIVLFLTEHGKVQICFIKKHQLFAVWTVVYLCVLGADDKPAWQRATAFARWQNHSFDLDCLYLDQ